MTLLDMRGQPCPLPVIAAKRLLRESAPGEEVVVIVDDDIAKSNLLKMAEGLGHLAEVFPGDEGSIEVLITVGKPKSAPELTGRGLVVAVGRGAMGDGDEALGKALMKAFLQSLTELETPPEHLLFFNGGAFLTTAGSGCLGDLRTLVDKGTTVATCGACLNFYKLTDKLEVGSVTNMLAIVGTMAQAAKVINV